MNAETIGAITEAELQATILDMAQTLGWRCHHEYDSRIAPRGRGSRTMTDKGYPDLTLVRGDKLLYVEVKKESGRVSRDQELWLAALRACGVRAEVWRPSDLDNGTIEVILKEGWRNTQDTTRQCNDCGKYIRGKNLPLVQLCWCGVDYDDHDGKEGGANGENRK